MNFEDAIRTCFTKYADFNGRASRGEYWWFVLFSVLAMVAASVLGRALPAFVVLGMFLPMLAAGVRRLHDTDRSGWWMLIPFVPVVGTIVLIVFLAQPSTPASRFAAA